MSEPKTRTSVSFNMGSTIRFLTQKLQRRAGPFRCDRNAGRSVRNCTQERMIVEHCGFGAVFERSRRPHLPVNGLFLSKEFHALYAAGYVTVTPDHQVRVSERLRTDWSNGRRYYPYDGKQMIQLPTDPAMRPSRDALAWHIEPIFKNAG